MQKTYETTRLQLLQLDESSAAQVLAYHLRNRSFLQEWDPVREDGFYTLKAQEMILRLEKQEMEHGRMLRFWITSKINPTEIIGTFSLSNIIRGAFHSCHLGYKLDYREINQGYMTEALVQGIGIAFDDLRLHRLEANIMPKNKASLRVVEKLGFQYEGLARKYLKINGTWEDHIHMVLLNAHV